MRPELAADGDGPAPAAVTAWKSELELGSSTNTQWPGASRRMMRFAVPTAYTSVPLPPMPVKSCCAMSVVVHAAGNSMVSSVRAPLAYERTFDCAAMKIVRSGATQQAAFENEPVFCNTKLQVPFAS